ncbi:putative pectinesterase 67 [Forsythia ovata]|uniref:pectinesterase n=1 Tax=Forsythia ovata TaxID=205694 RepID=A0ABD1PK53_9LAMI
MQDCEIFVIANKRHEIRGSITANSRQSAKESSGFIFVKGRVYGIGDVYLGRAKGAYSRVVFANTYFSRTVIPQGWTNWSHPGSTDNLAHAEYKCHGPGSASTNRAPWSKQLSDKEAAPFLSVDFIKGKEWLPAWL